VRLVNVFQLGIKELHSLRADRMMLLFIVYAFSVAIYLAATAMPDTLSRAPIAIVNEDRSPLSQRIVAAFYPPYFVPPAIVSPREMDRGLDEGRYAFGLDIPPNFQRDLLAGRSPAVQLNIDATSMTLGFSGAGYIQSIVTQEVNTFVRRNGVNAAPSVDLALRARFNPELNNSWFGSVMEVINTITMLSIILTGAALIREREHGTVEHLLAMPVTPFEIMASKVWSMGLVVLVAAALSLTFVVQGVLAVPIEGSVALFLCGAALHLFATTSLGIFLATLARSMPQFGLLLFLVLMPLQLLSGGMTPRESMPDLVRTLMLSAPTTHFVILGQAILYRGAGFSVVWPQFAALAAIGAAFFSFSLARFRNAIETMA